MQLTTSSACEAAAIVSRVFEPHTVRSCTGDAPLDFTFTHLALGDRVSLSRLRYGAPVFIETESLDDIVMVQMPITGTNQLTLRDGCWRLTTSSYSLLSPRQSVRQARDGDCEMLIVRAHTARLIEYVTNYLGYTPRSPLVFEGPVQDRVGPRARLLALASSAMEGSDGLHATIRALSEQLLLSILLFEHRNSYSGLLREPCGGAVPRHVKRAEDFIRANASAPLSTELIAREIGATVRTLQLGFKRFRDCTPMQMVKAVRLEHANRDLMTADPGGTSVTDIALKWGFGHLSSFAQDYRERYGEAPSATLRRH